MIRRFFAWLGYWPKHVALDRHEIYEARESEFVSDKMFLQRRCDGLEELLFNAEGELKEAKRLVTEFAAGKITLTSAKALKEKVDAL